MARTAEIEPVEDPYHARLRAAGVDPAVLERPPPAVTSLMQHQADPFRYIGSDAAFLEERFRLSHVSKDTEVQKLLSLGFVVLADWRNGHTAPLNVWVAGPGRQGVIMGRPKSADIAHRAARAARDWERRTGSRVTTTQAGDGTHEVTESNSPAERGGR